VILVIVASIVLTGINFDRSCWTVRVAGAYQIPRKNDRKKRSIVDRMKQSPAPPATQNTDDNFDGKKAGDEREFATGFKFRWCPAGNFKMGSPNSDPERDRDESPVDVKLTRGFWMCDTEVTQGQWKNVMNTVPWKDQENLQKKEDEYPACYVNQHDAIEFCEKLTQQEWKAGRLPRTCKYSLPTEAQWEYACRAGTTTKFSFGDDPKKLNDYGWWGGLAGDGNTAKELYPHRGGLKKPNAWGLKDMHGNVWELCLDFYNAKIPGGTDPIGKASDDRTVTKGGGWGSGAIDCRSAERYYVESHETSPFIGFRLAVVPAK
jgi:formylglycine-generating enzyme required for sulfatase activity